MQLLAEDMDTIGNILARRYFIQQKWRFTDLRSSRDKIIESPAIVSEQYKKYPYMSKDWYVENLAEKSIHLSTRWDELNVLVNLLQTLPGMFDFLLKMDRQKSLCMVHSRQSDLSSEQESAIADARKAGFNVYIFRAEVPDNMDFELKEVIGGITGRGIFKQEASN